MLYEHVAEVWKDREEGRFGSVVEPMLQWAKVKTIESGTQYVHAAGILSGVSMRTVRQRLRDASSTRNLRRKSFFEIWDSPEAKALGSKSKKSNVSAPMKYFCGPHHQHASFGASIHPSAVLNVKKPS